MVFDRRNRLFNVKKENQCEKFMIEQDYIMRMIDQLIKVLAKIFFNKEIGDYPAALKEIDSALTGITGLDYNFLSSLTDQDIISLIKISEDNEMTGMKCFVMGKLLKERAGAREMGNNINTEIHNEYEKALSLYLEGILSNKNIVNLFSDYFTDIETIVDKINNEDLRPEIRFKLFKFYELAGKYDKTENELFLLKKIRYIDIENEALNFYKRLETLTEEELRKGNFSKEEVKQGLDELFGKK